MRSDGAAAAAAPADDALVGRLDGPVDLEAFRRAARRLVARGVEPGRERWVVGGASDRDLFDAVGGSVAAGSESGEGCASRAHWSAAPATASTEGTATSPATTEPVATEPVAAEPVAAGPSAPRVPRAFAALTEAVILHRDPERFHLLYRLLWRLQHEPALRDDPLDPDMIRAQQLAREVHRDLHKMKAFVRFRPLDRGPARPPLHVAWFEPTHHIVEALAPFFVARFAQMHWSILTPERSLAWDGETLHVGPGARREDAPPADAGESLWLTYYEHMFNPARVNLSMMTKEMPRRYWKNLPEAELIAPLAAAAHERGARMIARAPTEPGKHARAARAQPRASGAGVGSASAAASISTSTTVTTADGVDPAPRSCVASPGERRQRLAETAREAAACTRCPLHRQATQTVFGAGRIDAPLMFVGEQPGDREDLSGQPFVGPSGALFARALAAAGIDRAQVYVTNAVKHFKYELRGTRRIHKTAAQQEAAACLDWLEREIALVRPRAIVALGATAARSLLGGTVAVMQERGRWRVREGDAIPVLVTLHPAALLRLEDGPREAALPAWFAEIAAAALRATATEAASVATPAT